MFATIADMKTIQYQYHKETYFCLKLKAGRPQLTLSSCLPALMVVASATKTKSSCFHTVLYMSSVLSNKTVVDYCQIII